MSVVLLAALLSLRGPMPSTAESNTTDTGADHSLPQSGTRLSRGYLRLSGAARPPMVEALTLRVPHLRFEPFTAATNVAQTEELSAFVDITGEPTSDPMGPQVFALTIVISDGRAFDRHIETVPADEETTRVLASTVANLLTAIEAGTVAPDRGEVPLPVAAPVCPTCHCPTPEPCPTPKRPSAPAPTLDETPSVPLLEVGPVVMANTTLGLGEPTVADRFAAAGATLGVHARLRSGAFFGAELRASGRGEPEGNRIVRLRAALGAGYRHRHGPLSLGVSAWATVEPWWFAGAELDPQPAPLLGGALRVRPAILLPNIGGSRLSLATGPMLELAASAATGEHPRISLVVVDQDDETTTHLRVGGLELTTGFTVTLWFDTRRGTSAPRPPSAEPGAVYLPHPTRAAAHRLCGPWPFAPLR